MAQAFKGKTMLHKGVSECYDEGRFSDVTVVVNGRSFNCHRIILSAMSDYFKCMFTHDFVESKQNSVEIDDVIDTDIFEIIITYFYSGEIPFTNEIIESILKASVYLQSEALKDECINYIHSILCPQNSVKCLRLSKFIRNESLISRCRCTIMEEFKDVNKNDFVELDVSDVLELVSDCNGEIMHFDENSVCSAVYLWLSHSDRRNVFIEDIMAHVKLSFIDPTYIISNLLQSVQLMSNRFYNKKIKDALEFHFGCKDLNECPREDFGVKNCYLLFSYSKDDARVIVHGYLLHENKFVTLASSPLGKFGEGFVTCRMGNVVYVTGGIQTFDDCLSYSPTTNTWTSRGHLNEGRYGHSMMATGNSVFAVGGVSAFHFKSTESIEVFSVEDDTWTKFGELQIPVYESSLALIDNKVYILGGKSDKDDGTDFFCGDIQCVDIQTKVCTIVHTSGSLQPVHYLQSFLFEDTVCLLDENGRLSRFCSLCNSVSKICEISMAYRKYYLAKFHPDTLTLFGGYVKLQNNPHIEVRASNFLEIDVSSLRSVVKCPCRHEPEDNKEEATNGNQSTEAEKTNSCKNISGDKVNVVDLSDDIPNSLIFDRCEKVFLSEKHIEVDSDE